VDEVCEAINTLAVRGAPAIGIAAAMGLALSIPAGSRGNLAIVLADAHGRLRGARPTAVNLERALDRAMKAGLRHRDDADAMRGALRDEATKIRGGSRHSRRIGDTARLSSPTARAC
jgi:methylthioribose-1-phosphate isomerase